MNRPSAVRLFAAALLAVSSVAGAEKPALKSFIPANDVGKFLVDKLDVTTFRSSLGPRRQPGSRHFADLGLKPTKITDSAVELDDAEWFYGITVLERADKNGDGLEDLVIQVVDNAKKGAYRDSQKLLVTRFSETGDLIALAFAP